jgi:hypothetical protein
MPYHPVVSLQPLADHIVELARAAEETAAANLVELDRFARLLPDPSGDHRFFDQWKKMVDEVVQSHRLPPLSPEEASRYFTVQLQRALHDGDRRLRSVAFELALAGQPVPTDSMMLGLRARLFDVLHLETYKVFAHHQCLRYGMTVDHLVVLFREGYALQWVRSVIERHGDLPGVEPDVLQEERLRLFRECAARAASSVSPEDFKGFYQKLQTLLVQKAELMRRKQ